MKEPMSEDKGTEKEKTEEPKAMTIKPEYKLPMMIQLKRQMLKEYRQSTPGLMDGVMESKTGYDMDSLFRNIIKDLINGTEDLMGTSLMLEAKGELKGASDVIIRRADLLKIISDIIGRQKELHQKAGEVDYNSPAFRLFQELCFKKLIESMQNLNIDDEMAGLILKEWQNSMSSWDRDLKKMIKDEEEK